MWAIAETLLLESWKTCRTNSVIALLRAFFASVKVGHRNLFWRDKNTFRSPSGTEIHLVKIWSKGNVWQLADALKRIKAVDLSEDGSPRRGCPLRGLKFPGNSPMTPASRRGHCEPSLCTAIPFSCYGLQGALHLPRVT